MDWDTRIWRYRNNDNVVKIIENNYVALNFRENDLFVLVFFREIEEENNNFDTDINYFFIRVSTTFPLFSEYREYINIFSKSKVRQLSDHILIEYTINTGDIEPLYGPIYNLLIKEFSTLRDNLEEFLEKRIDIYFPL